MALGITNVVAVVYRRWVLAEKFRGSFMDLGLCKQYHRPVFLIVRAAEVSAWI
jgi:hypothetical protein